MSSENNKLEAEIRSTKTKADLNKLRASGSVPGVLYGDIEKNISLSVKKNTLDHFLKTTNFKSRVINISLDGKEYQVLPRDIEFDKISNQPIHVDFQKLSANTKVVVWIPVKFLNEDTCPGLKMGGVLNIVRRKVELDCPADKIPSELIVDLEKREIGESIHISAIELPDGVTPTIKDRDFTIATVAAPTVVKEPEPSTDAASTDATAAGDTAAADDKAAEEKKDEAEKK
jgi:large subunit ribosomal protein L25